MSLADDLQTVLVADATLLATLTGGVYAGKKINRQATPLAFDANGEILPCALVKEENEGAWGPFENTSRAFVRIFVYERSEYANINAALDRIYSLLHRQKALSGKWELLYVDDLGGMEDPALACSLAISRYQVLRER